MDAEALAAFARADAEIAEAETGAEHQNNGCMHRIFSRLGERCGRVVLAGTNSRA